MYEKALRALLVVQTFATLNEVLIADYGGISTFSSILQKKGLKGKNTYSSLETICFEAFYT